MSSKLTPNRRGGLRDFPGGGYPERSLLIALELHDPANAAARCESYRNGGDRMTTKESPWLGFASALVIAADIVVLGPMATVEDR